MSIYDANKKPQEKEAIDFITDGLDINYEELQHDRCALLYAIVQNFQTKVPFQNLVLLSTPPEARHRLTWPEIKNALLNKMGGMCYDMHVMFGVLMMALGYDTHWTHSCVVDDDDHILTLVRNLRFHGDLHLIEIGTIVPTLEPVPLDFEEESMIYQSAFLEFKFQRDGEVIRRLHRKGDTILAPLPNRQYFDGWRQFCTFNPAKLYQDVHQFDQCYDKLFIMDERERFHTAFLLLAFKNGKGLQVYGRNRLLKENENGDLEASLLEENEILPLFREYCPCIPDLVLQKAIAFVKEWNS